MKLRRRVLILALLLVPALLSAADPGKYLVYIGTYTRENSKGIYVSRFDAATGEVTAPELAAETASPSFLAIHPNRRFLYAVGELYDRQKGGSLTAFSIDPQTGKLTLLNSVGTRGGGPCYATVDKTGQSVLVANYGGGSVAAFLAGADGRLGEASSFIQHAGSGPEVKRQSGPHAHSINISADNRFALAADLGLDQLFVYRLDPAKASLTAHDPPFAKLNPGAGPRHFAFHPGGKLVYTINELNSTVTAFRYDAARGALSDLGSVSTLPKDFAGTNHTAEIQIHPSGKFLYGSNRGHDSIAVFAIDGGKGTLRPVEHVPTQGKTPRNFTVDPTGAYLFAANQNTGNIVVFRIDPKTGRLTPTGRTLQVGSPVCVKFVRAG